MFRGVLVEVTMLGQILHDRYKVVGRLGQQEDWQVLMAREVRGFAPLKVYLPTDQFAQTAAWKTLCEQALIQQRIRVDGVLRVVDAWDEAEPACVVVEHLDGLDLPRLLGSLTLSEVVEVFQQLCELIAQLHAANQPHGTLDASRVLVTAEGQVKLLAWSPSVSSDRKLPSSDAERQSVDLAKLSQLLRAAIAEVEASDSNAPTPSDAESIIALREIAVRLTKTPNGQTAAADAARQIDQVRHQFSLTADRRSLRDLLARHVSESLPRKAISKSPVRTPAIEVAHPIVEVAPPAVAQPPVESARQETPAVVSQAPGVLSDREFEQQMAELRRRAAERRANPKQALKDSWEALSRSIDEDADDIAPSATAKSSNCAAERIAVEPTAASDDSNSAVNESDEFVLPGNSSPAMMDTQTNMATTTQADMPLTSAPPAPPAPKRPAANAKPTAADWKNLRQQASARAAQRSQDTRERAGLRSMDWKSLGPQSTADKLKAGGAAVAIVLCGWFAFSSDRDVPTDRLNRQAIYGTIEGAEGRSGEITFSPKDGSSGPTAGTAIIGGKYEFSRADGPVPGPYEARILLKSTDQQGSEKPSGQQDSDDAWTSAVPAGFDPERTVSVTVPPSRQAVAIRLPR